MAKTTCALNVGCGDGIITVLAAAGIDEKCDDGDVDSGDGCSNDCKVEDGWTCTGEPSVCTIINYDLILRGYE